MVVSRSCLIQPVTDTWNSDTLKRAVEKEGYKALKGKLEVRDGIRTSLLCIDILGIFGWLVSAYIPETCAEDRRAGSTSLAEPSGSNSTMASTSVVTRFVKDSLECLKNEPWMNQRKCVKTLSALSQTGRRLPLSGP